MGNSLKILSALMLLMLAGCAGTHQAGHLTPEQRHRAAVHEMLVASPIPDLLIGGIEKGFKKHAKNPQQQAVFDCAVAHLSRDEIAGIYTETSMPYFTEQEARELTKQMRSELGKRGAAHFITKNLGRPNPYKPLSKAEQKQYSMDTLALWVKTPLIMKDEGAKADMKVLLVQKLTACKQQ